jgi:SPP1 gp7 family putative phage head morphogenesis protein
MTRNQHRNLFNTILRKQEERSVGAVYYALRKQYVRTINNIKKYGIQYAINNLNLELFNREIGKAVERIYLQAGLFMANRTLSELKKVSVHKNNGGKKGADTLYSSLSYKDINSPISSTHRLRGTAGSTFLHPSFLETKYQTFGFNEEWVNMIISYFQRHLLEKAVIGVSNTTRERILNILSKATVEGWSNDKIVKELSDLTEIRGRARMITRTETVRAANYGTLIGADKYEYEVEKEWIAVLDNRTRHSHSNVDGQRRDNSDTFSNGLQFPGDPNGGAAETINCRCSLAMVAKRDSRGRLIPKKNLIAA